MEGMSFAAVKTPSSQYFNVTVASPSSSAQKLSCEGFNARNLAIVCRRFCAVIERAMYTHITWPQSTYTVQSNYDRSPLVYLVRTLLDRPHLARRTKSLHVWVRDRRLIQYWHEQNHPPENLYIETCQRAFSYVSKFGLSVADLLNWSVAMHEHQELALCAFSIALTYLTTCDSLNSTHQWPESTSSPVWVIAKWVKTQIPFFRCCPATQLHHFRLHWRPVPNWETTVYHANNPRTRYYLLR
jgi:hypothetical protein